LRESAISLRLVDLLRTCNESEEEEEEAESARGLAGGTSQAKSRLGVVKDPYEMTVVTYVVDTPTSTGNLKAYEAFIAKLKCFLRLAGGGASRRVAGR